MAEILALVRAGWLTESSYRLRMLLSLGTLLLTVVPVYFISQALQPVMAGAIQGEGGQLFGFLLIGMVAFTLLSTATSAPPGVVGSSIASGTLEALLATPAPLPLVLAGLLGYGVAWNAVRVGLLLLAGWALGAPIAWSHLPLAVLLLALIFVAYLAVGLMGAALVLVFRTPGPLVRVALLASGLLGGVYYPTHVVPEGLGWLPPLIPLTYGLRALRRALLDGAGWGAVAGDVGVLALIATLLFAAGSLAFARALRHARHAGTLAQY